MTDDTPLPFELPAIRRKKLTVDFDGGNQSSDGGLLLLRAAEQKVGIIARMAAALPDRRDPARLTHTSTEIIGARVLGIACGYEDGIDHDALRDDPWPRKQPRDWRPLWTFQHLPSDWPQL